MQVSGQQMADAHLPMGYRDQCAHILIPLNKCRRQTMYMPFKCQDLRHEYEKCQYDLYKIRVNRRKQALKNPEA